MASEARKFGFEFENRFRVRKRVSSLRRHFRKLRLSSEITFELENGFRIQKWRSVWKWHPRFENGARVRKRHSSSKMALNSKMAPEVRKWRSSSKMTSELVINYYYLVVFKDADLNPTEYHMLLSLLLSPLFLGSQKRQPLSKTVQMTGNIF